MKHDRCMLSFAVWIMLGLAGFAQTGPTSGGTGSYHVSYFNLSKEQDGENPVEFVASLDAAPGMAAALAIAGKGDTDSWRAAPANVELARWISLVKVTSGRQRDFFAFVFADREGTVRYVARRPSRIPVEAPKYPLTVPPGPDQIPGNAIRETATDFLYRFAVESAKARPVVRIVIGPGEPDPAAKGDGLGASALPVETAEVLAFAAAFEAGWRPTTGKAETTIHFSLAEESRLFNTAQARLEPNAPGFNRRYIPREKIYAHLVHLFFKLRESARILETAAYGAQGSELLGWQEGLLIVKDGLTVKAVEPESGRVLWSRSAAEKDTPLFRMRPNQRGRPDLVRYDRQIVRLDLTNGTERMLAPVGVGASGRFDLAPDGRLAVVESGQLRLYKDGALAWTWDGAGTEARPTWGGERVFVEGADGLVHGLDPARQSELWRESVGGAGNSRLSFRDSILFVDTGKNLVALNAEDGKRLWTAETGDVLLDEPELMEGQVLAVVKPNKLRIWNARTGAPAASRDWPTWLRSVRAFKTAQGWLIACADWRNRLSLLRPGKLETVTEVAFPRPLTSVAAYGANVPGEWALTRPAGLAGGEADLISGMDALLVKRQPALLAADEDGFIYAIITDQADRR